MSTPAGNAERFEAVREALGYGLETPEHPFHLVWGHVVPDIPDFCRELVAALAEE